MWIRLGFSATGTFPKTMLRVVGSRRWAGYSRFVFSNVWSTLGLLLANACAGVADGGPTEDLGCEVGTEGCSCYGNWSCNYRLSCVDEVCVDRLGEIRRSEISALRAADPIATASSEECLTCVEDGCVSPLAECYSEVGCSPLFSCLLTCSNEPAMVYTDCASDCYSAAPLRSHTPATHLQLCTGKMCDSACHSR